MRRILCTGSRYWTDTKTILEALKEHRPEPGESVTIVVGDARGADEIVRRCASYLGVFTVELHKARWEHLGRAAGPERNERMVRSGADLCLAFDEGGRGTADCMKRASDRGIPVLVVPLRREVAS